jgi:hypothetical protein
VVIEFERQVDYNARGSGNELQRRETTEITCDVDLDHGCSLRLASDEPEGDRVWRILEFSIDYRPFDLREAATSWRARSYATCATRSRSGSLPRVPGAAAGKPPARRDAGRRPHMHSRAHRIPCPFHAGSMPTPPSLLVALNLRLQS